MLSPIRPIASILLTGLLGSVVAGCSAEVKIGDSDQVSGSKLAAEIRREYAKQQGDSGIHLTSITCEEVEAEVDAEVHCTGRNSREIDIEFGGEVTAVQSDGLDYHWRIDRAFAPGAFYAGAARDPVEERLGQRVLDVQCPTRIELREGEQVRCEAELDSAGTVPIDLLLTDLDGGFRLRLPEATKPGAAA